LLGIEWAPLSEEENIILGICVFSNNNEEKMPVKQITDWTVFGEIQTATTTFIARLTRFS